jgi:SagB-type dehydrogenase family enzyme
LKNLDRQAAWAYHDGTKHSYESLRTNAHFLDWENQPLAFKIYADAEAIPLPQKLSSAGMPALEAISIADIPRENEVIPSIQTLAEILYLSAGITKRRSYAGGEMLFRAAACTGALYHVDLYLVCGDLAELAAGVYHFSPHDFALRRLRTGDYRGVLVQASGREPAVVTAPVIVAAASTYWRNAWKYQSRAYRHCYWDSGTILANLLAAAASRSVPARVVLGFVDELVSRLLGLDTHRECPLSLVPLGHAPIQPAHSSPPLDPIKLESKALSKKEIDYPAIRTMHEASSLETEEEVLEWRKRALAVSSRTTQTLTPIVIDRMIALRPFSDQEIPPDTLEEVVQRRGSTREFAREPIGFREFSTMIDRATRGIPTDFLASEGASLNDLYLIVHAVEDLSPGAYVFHPEQRALELLKAGDFRREAGYLGLGQEIPADASVDVFFLTNLNQVLDRLGNRGYRAAQLEASISGGKLYLAAYALHLGASGLTFFDDDVTEFFSPHAARKSVMFLIALGKSVKRRNP